MELPVCPFIDKACELQDIRAMQLSLFHQEISPLSSALGYHCHSNCQIFDDAMLKIANQSITNAFPSSQNGNFSLFRSGFELLLSCKILRKLPGGERIRKIVQGALRDIKR